MHLPWHVVRFISFHLLFFFFFSGTHHHALPLTAASIQQNAEDLRGQIRHLTKIQKLVSPHAPKWFTAIFLPYLKNIVYESIMQTMEKMTEAKILVGEPVCWRWFITFLPPGSKPEKVFHSNLSFISILLCVVTLTHAQFHDIICATFPTKPPCLLSVHILLCCDSPSRLLSR